MTPLLSELREPPVVGRFYMVPVVRYRFRRVVREWPVIGPRHDDGDVLRFPYRHYHFDGRFLLKTEIATIAVGRDMSLALGGTVLVEPSEIETSLWEQQLYGRLPRKPKLRRRKCQRSSYEYSEEGRVRIAKRVGRDAITEDFGPIAEPIRLDDGRLLCPHRKADLSQFPPDSDGIVTCPLHGLRVRCVA